MTDDLPEAFRPKCGDPWDEMAKDNHDAQADAGYDACLRATDAVNLRRERDALQAALHDLLTGPTLAFSDATADRMIADTLREARGEA